MRAQRARAASAPAPRGTGARGREPEAGRKDGRASRGAGGCGGMRAMRARPSADPRTAAALPARVPLRAVRVLRLGPRLQIGRAHV